MPESFAAEKTDCKQHQQEYDLEQAVASLPEQYRDVILLRFYAGRSCKEIASTLDMKLSTVTKTLSRAYSELRSLLKKQRQNSEVR